MGEVGFEDISLHHGWVSREGSGGIGKIDNLSLCDLTGSNFCRKHVCKNDMGHL